MELEREAQRGEDAARILAEPLLNEAFEQIERAYIDAWINTPARDTDGKEFLWQLVKNLEKVRSHLKSTLETGKMAKIQLERKSLLSRLNPSEW